VFEVKDCVEIWRKVHDQDLEPVEVVLYLAKVSLTFPYR
jgi:hypothetical protein